MKKRIFSAILTLCMIVGLVPISVLAASTGSSSTGTTSSSSVLEAMKAQNSTPPQSFYEDTLTPYGTGEGEVFTLLENSELLTYTTANVKINNSDNTKSFTYENWKDSKISDDASSVWTYDGGYMSDVSNILSYTQAVAFDPTGCGLRNYIAFVGYNYDSGCAEVWFSSPNYGPVGTGQGTLLLKDANTEEGRVPLKVQLWDCSWFKNANKDYGLDTVDSKNFFQITAGDYDNDGCDSLVVYCGFGGGKTSYTGVGTMGGLTEITLYTDSARTKNFANTVDLSDNLLHPSFRNNYKTSTNPNDQLGVALETGDVNGDGIDDLAVLSYHNDATYKSGISDHLTYSPYLTVCYGEQYNDPLISFTGVGSYIYRTTGNKKEFYTMASPGVSIGDIDGDGYNEVVTAGFLNFTKENDGVIIQNNGRFAFTYFNCENIETGKAPKQVGSMRDITDLSYICYGDHMREHEHIWQQFSVECVAFDGINTPEYMFLNGYIYKLNDDGDLVRADNLSLFEAPAIIPTTVFGAYAATRKEVFVHSAAVGSFKNAKSGAESIVMTVGFKTDGKNQYAFMKIWIHYDADQKKFSAEGTLFFADGLYDHPSHDRLNCIVVACDYDNDSLVARYKGKTFAYTDPNVVAVLQAAPYFEELEAGNSSTTYGYSESYTTSEATGSEFSASVGASLELELAHVKATIEGGYATELIKEYTESREKTYTTTFEANGENQVIIRRTLVYLYDYEVSSGYHLEFFNDNGSLGVRYVHDWEDYGLVVTVPQYPVMTSLSTDQYDEFATAYNEQFGISSAEEAKKTDGTKPYKLDIIGDKADKYFLNNEGNPFAYASTHNDYANGMELSGSTWMELSHSGGTSQLEYSASLTTEQSKTKSDGGFFNLSILAGGGIGNFKVFGGVTTSIESLNSRTVSTAKMTGTNTGGSVQNLNKSDSDYRFSWKLIGWKTTGDLFKDVLFVGYAVQGISAPIKPVTDLEAKYILESDADKETVELTWTAPSADYKRTLPTSFDVYRVLSDGEYEKLGTVSSNGAGKSHTFTVDVSSYTENYATFVVAGTTTEIDGINSSYSNEALCFLVTSYKEVKDLVDGLNEELQGKIDNLSEELKKGQSDAIAKAVKDLTDAYQKADKELNTLLKSQIDGVAKDLATLDGTVKKAKESLENAIEKVQENLDNAKKELETAIETNAEDFQKKLDELKEAMELADSVINSTLADQAVKNEVFENLFKTTNEVIDALDKAYKKADSQLKSSIDALKKELGELRDKHAAEIEALRKEKDDEIAALRKEKNDDIASLRTELTALKTQVNDNKAESDATVATLASVDTVQEDNMGVLRTVSYIGLGIAGASFLANVVLFTLPLIKKRKSL